MLHVAIHLACEFSTLMIEVRSWICPHQGGGSGAQTASDTAALLTGRGGGPALQNMRTMPNPTIPGPAPVFMPSFRDNKSRQASASSRKDQWARGYGGRIQHDGMFDVMLHSDYVLNYVFWGCRMLIVHSSFAYGFDSYFNLCICACPAALQENLSSCLEIGRTLLSDGH